MNISIFHKRSIILLLLVTYMSNFSLLWAKIPKNRSVVCCQTNKGVTCEVKTVPRKAFKKIFSAAIKSSFIPLFLSIDNQSESIFLMNTSDISLALQSSEMAYVSSTKSIRSTYAVLGGVLGILLIPIVGSLGIALAFSGYETLGVAILVTSVPLTPVASGAAFYYYVPEYLGIETCDYNSLDDNSLCWSKSLEIKPHEKIEKYFFVRKRDLKDNFSITLHEADNESKTCVFDVALV